MCASAILLASGIAQAQNYKIKLVRPDKVGDQYASSVTAKVSETTVTTKNGEETDTKTEGFTAACQGTVKVLAIDEKTGAATKIRYQVDTMTKNGRALYPQGTVIIAKRSGSDTSFEIDGERPDEDQAPVLTALLGDVSRTHGLTNEAEAKGTSSPQQVGNSWPIKTDQIAEQFSGENSPVTPEQLKGESELVAVKKVEGQDVMIIKSKITADGLKKDLAVRGAITDGKLTAEVTDTLPLDETLPKLFSTSKLTLTMTIAQPLGATKLIVTTKQERKERRDPVDE